MKKWFSLLAVALACCTLIGCAAFAENDPLMDIAMDMARDVHTLANDEMYFTINGMPSTAYTSAFAAADCDDLRSAYRILSVAPLITEIMSGGQLSPAGRNRIVCSMYQLENFWNGAKSVDAMRSSTLLSWSRSYAEPDDFQNCALILNYGNAICIVSCIETGESIITASAAPLFLDEGENIENVLQFFREKMSMYVINQIYPDQAIDD